jgi:CheY-like chemotaxis protein
MQDTVTTSWHRRSDQANNAAESRHTRSAQQRGAGESARLQAWETEGGKTARCTEAVRILIVDSDVGAADSLELMLHASGYMETRVAYSAHAALAMAADFQPTVVLLDFNLLDMTGYELAQSLREQAQSEALRLIALTSSREHPGRELAREAGFERYLLKPVAAVDLSALLEMSPP